MLNIGGVYIYIVISAMLLAVLILSNVVMFIITISPKKIWSIKLYFSLSNIDQYLKELLIFRLPIRMAFEQII